MGNNFIEFSISNNPQTKRKNNYLFIIDTCSEEYNLEALKNGLKNVIDGMDFN